MTQTLYFTSWTDEVTTVEPTMPDTVPVINPLGALAGQAQFIDAVPKKQVVNLQEGSGGRAVAKSISDIMNTAVQNPSKPMIIEINIG